MAQQMDRHCKLDIEQVLPLIKIGKNKSGRVEMHGTTAHVSGMRLSTFKQKGITCVHCGLVGSFFALETGTHSKAPNSHHLNLYSVAIVDGVATEVLMTHDHIIPLSLGGADSLENTQPMCSPCNSKKGSFI